MGPSEPGSKRKRPREPRSAPTHRGKDSETRQGGLNLGHSTSPSRDGPTSSPSPPTPPKGAERCSEPEGKERRAQEGVAPSTPHSPPRTSVPDFPGFREEPAKPPFSDASGASAKEARVCYPFHSPPRSEGPLLGRSRNFSE